MQEMIAHILTGGTKEVRACAVLKILKKWGIKPEYTIPIVKNEEKLTIGVEEVRDTLSHLFLLPPGKNNQCLLISEAQTLTQEAMNALLKTIEEPPDRTYILLSTGNTESLLPTILSRCRILPLKPASYDVPVETQKKLHDELSILTQGAMREKLILLKKYLKREDAVAFIDALLAYLDALIFSENKNSGPENRLKQYAFTAQKLLHARDLLLKNCNPILVMDDMACTVHDGQKIPGQP